VIEVWISLVGLALVQGGGAVLRRLAEPSVSLAMALRSPSSVWVGLAVLYAVSLGPVGALLLGALAAIGWWVRVQAAPAQGGSWGWFSAGLGVLVLARPWVPTHWDEFVWLAKARLESLGFGSGVRLALDPSAHLIPRGYPPLWPSAVGWLSLGDDALTAQVIAGSLLMLLAAAAAVEAWLPAWERPGSGLGWLIALGALLGAPLVWIHLRATYVDLPLGLLGLALFGHLFRAAQSPMGRPGVISAALAIVLVALKDDGLAHLIAGTGAALVAARAAGARFRTAWRLGLPAALGVLAAGLWRWLADRHGVGSVDHALTTLEYRWLPRLVELLLLHASDLYSWGIFWAVGVAVLAMPEEDARVRGLRTMVLLNLVLICFALLAGPERVRVFAENGTLLNRLLLQLWPAVALAILLRLRTAVSAFPSAHRAQ
jgi:hypothetical protein